MGVDVFFVLAGYLMTAKILKLQESGINIDLLKLWSGRVRRLLPTAYIMIGVTVIWVILLKQDLIRTLWGDAVSSAFYMTNWWFIFHKLSYFDSFGIPSPLKHLWFLGVQEQFYFVWSIVLIAVPRYFNKRGAIKAVAFVGIILSSALMGIMYNPDMDPSRIYYGTDTRAFELLIGSCLAVVLPVQKYVSQEISASKRNIINITSVISFAAFILSAIYIDEFQSFLYRGGMLLLDINAVLLIVCISNPNSFMGKILSLKPLRWIGTRSFQIYLWHYPIIVLSTPIYEIGNPNYWRIGLQLAIICITAELAFRFLEMPMRKLGLREYYRRYLKFNKLKLGRLASIKRISAVMAASLVLVFAFDALEIVSIGKNVENAELNLMETNAADAGYTASYKDSVLVLPEKKMSRTIKRHPASFNEKCAIILAEEYRPSYYENYESDYTTNEMYKGILAIGDSIMLDIAENLKEKYKNITINGKVARQMSDAIKLAPAYAEFNDGDKAVIIELGTNGYITDKQIDTLLDSFSKAHVYLVNTRVPRSWEKKVNKILKEKAEERGNVILINWYAQAIEHPEYFGHDGVHLMTSGSKALTNLISEALSTRQ